MKIKINGIERECQVVQAPKGSFCIWSLNEGCFGFPEFVIIAPAVSQEEMDCGNIVTCPIRCSNGGYEYAEPDEIYSEIDLYIFRLLVVGFYLYWDEDMESTGLTAERIYDKFKRHGTVIHKRLEDYMSNKEYLTDERLLDAEKCKIDSVPSA